VLGDRSAHLLGGTHGDLIKKFEAGYTAGVKSVDPSIKVEVKYLTEDPNDGKTGFENPSGGKLAAEGQLDKGADVIYHAAGKSGNGVFEAVEAAGEGNMAIGVDSDQYLTASDSQKPFILTSMLKRIDTAVFDYIKSVDDGKVASGNVTYDLASNGVGYSTSGGFVDDIKDRLDPPAGVSAAVVGLPVLAAAWAVLSPPVMLSKAMTQDLLFNLSGAWHVYSGHVAHVDFHDASGRLSFLLTALRLDVRAESDENRHHPGGVDRDENRNKGNDKLGGEIFHARSI